MPLPTDAFPDTTWDPENPEDLGWAIGLAGHHCGRPIHLSRPVPAPTRVVRALQGLSATDFHLSVYGDSPGAYSITVLDGYLLTDPRIGPDRFEENDYCRAADLNATDSTKRIDPRAPFVETLTIDNPYEIDWYRFTVPGGDPPVAQLVTVRVSPQPLGGSDSSNVDLVLLDEFADVVAEASSPGSSEFLIAEVFGDHYLLVNDRAGVPTRYTLCVTIGTLCTPP
jgi:hypothetical protein